jgi:hypothetical protein
MVVRHPAEILALLVIFASIPLGYAQGLPIQGLGFNTTIRVQTVMDVEKGGDATIETRVEMSASEEFNKAMEAQLERLDEEEARERMIRQMEAALTLLGYDVESVDVWREDTAMVEEIKIRGLATELDGTWIIKPDMGGMQMHNLPATTFTHYFVSQEVEIRLPKGSQILLVLPEPYEEDIGGARVRLERKVEAGYVPIIRLSYYAQVPPGMDLRALQRGEELKVVYALKPLPLSSKGVLALSAIIIAASIAWAYRLRR